MVQEIVFRLSPSLLGSFDQPNPAIPDGSGVILLQRGNAFVGSWDAEVCGFVHPFNQHELAAEALAAVLGSYPDADMTTNELRVFTCPRSLVDQFVWQSE